MQFVSECSIQKENTIKSCNPGKVISYFIAYLRPPFLTDFIIFIIPVSQDTIVVILTNIHNVLLSSALLPCPSVLDGMSPLWKGLEQKSVSQIFPANPDIKAILPSSQTTTQSNLNWLPTEELSVDSAGSYSIQYILEYSIACLATFPPPALAW